jgi:hypothetical protein
MLEHSSRRLQILAQLVHLGPRLSIFSSHLVDQSPQLTDLVLQVAHGIGRLARRRGRRILRSAI